MSAPAPPSPGDAGLARTVLLGCVAAASLGFAAGMLRYWFGFFVLIQGAAAGGLGAWGVSLLAGGTRKGPKHPGPARAFRCALLWTAVFIVAELAGLGLAQPWFEPLGWAARVLEGRTVEPVYGIHAAGPVHKAFAGGASGPFWLVLNAIDLAIMLVFFMTLPWSAPGSIRKRRTHS